MATMKTLNGYGFNATELNGKTSDSYLQLGDDGTGSTGEAPTINAGTFGGMTVSQFVDMIYPVGSIYMSANATSPATLFGGTWESIGGRFLLGADSTYTAGGTGGEATNTIGASNLPSKIPLMYSHNSGSSGRGGIMANTIYTDGENSGYSWVGTGMKSIPINNMPPYLAVYMWKRTA